MANITITETTPSISLNTTSNVVTVTNNTSNVTVANVAAADPAAVRLALSVTDAGGDGSLSYANTTGVFTYTGPSAAEVRAHISNTSPILYNSTTGVVSIDSNAVFSGKDTDDLSEGSTNLYYTNARANTAIAAYTGAMTNVAGNITTTANVTGANFIGNVVGTTKGLVDTTSNITTTANVSAGNVIATKFFGDGSELTGIDELTNAQAQAFIEANGLDMTANIDIAGANTTLTSNIDIGLNQTLTIVGNATSGTGGVGPVEWVGNITGMNSSANISTSGNIKANNGKFTTANIDHTTTGQANVTGNATINGELGVGGNLNVTGNINSETVVDLFVEDRNITMQYGATGTPSANSQIFIDRGSAANSFIIWSEADDKFGFSNDGSNITFFATDTDGLTEGSTNLYYTTAKSNSAIAAYTGAMTNMTGNLTTTANISGGNVLGTFIGNITGNVTGAPSSLAGLDTADLAEGTNLYYTTARANSAITAYTGAFANLTGNITTTANISGGNILGTLKGVIDSTSNITTTANISGGNILGTVRGEINTTSNITTTANITGGKLIATEIDSNAQIATTGNINVNNFLNFAGNTATTASPKIKFDAAIGDGQLRIAKQIAGSEANIGIFDSTPAAYNTANTAIGGVFGVGNIVVDKDLIVDGSTANITTTANISAGNVLVGDIVIGSDTINEVDAITSSGSANLTLTGQQNGVHLNKAITGIESRIVDLDTTGYAIGEASAGLPATTTLGTSAMALLVSINHTSGSNTATANDIYAGALAGVGLDVPAVRGPDFNTGLTGGDIIMTAESGTAGRGNLEAAMTTEGSTSPFIGSPAKSGIANASANLYGQDKGWTIFNISNGSRSDLFPVQAHITGVTNDTITFSENAIASGTTTVALQPGMAQSTVANTNIKYLTKIGDKAAANSGINGGTLYGYLGSFEHEETLANLTYDRISYANTSTIAFTSIDTKQSADMNSGSDSAVRYPRLLSVGPNTTPDPFSGRVETNNPSPIGVTVEDDGSTYAGNNAPYSKFLFNTYTGAFDDMTIHPNWATVGNTGNVTLDLPQLKAPSLQFKTFRGEKSDGNTSNYLMQAGEVVGKIQFSPGQTTGLGFQGADLYNPPAAITVDVGDANINTGAANTHMHITTSPYPAGGSLGYFRNNANAVSGINQQTNFTTKGGNVTIAAQTDGMITLAPTPDYGDSGNATVWTRFPGTTHAFHTFLDAKFLGSKAGTLVEIQPKSGTTTGSGGLGYDSKGNSTVRLSSHHSNSAVKAQWDITNEQSSGNLMLRDHTNSSNKLEVSTARAQLGTTLRLQNLTTTQINALSSPQAGDVVYNTTLNQVCVYNGSAWQKITQSAM